MDPLVDRRRLLQAGGITILASVLAGGCTGSRSPSPVTTAPGATTTLIEGREPDVGLLRLASSLEHYAVGLYQTAAGSGLVKTQVVADAIKYFADQHTDHAKADEEWTAGAGGQPFATPNQVVADLWRPRLEALSSEADVVKLAYDVEEMVAATYLQFLGGFQDQKLNAAVAGIMAVEARHVAVLGMILSGQPAALAGVAPRQDSPPYPAGGFETKAAAVTPGTGV